MDTNSETTSDPVGLIGCRVEIHVPDRTSGYWQKGEITGYGIPLIRVHVDGTPHYRHMEMIARTGDTTTDHTN